MEVGAFRPVEVSLRRRQPRPVSKVGPHRREAGLLRSVLERQPLLLEVFQHRPTIATNTRPAQVAEATILPLGSKNSCLKTRHGPMRKQKGDSNNKRIELRAQKGKKQS